MALDFSLHGAPAASTVVLHSRSAALLANGVSISLQVFKHLR